MPWIVLEKAQSLILWRRQELREEVKATLGGWVAVREPANLGKRGQRGRGRGAQLVSWFLVSSFSCVRTLTITEQWVSVG